MEAKRRFFLRLLLISLGLALGLGFAELGLRVAAISYPRFYEFDEYCGAVLRPNVAGWWTTEGRAFVRINSDGLRDVEHSISKPPGVFRIAILGDSYAEALQVPLEATFWTIMERQLNQRECFGGRRVEVLNF